MGRGRAVHTGCCSGSRIGLCQDQGQRHWQLKVLHSCIFPLANHLFLFSSFYSSSSRHSSTRFSSLIPGTEPGPLILHPRNLSSSPEVPVENFIPMTDSSQPHKNTHIENKHSSAEQERRFRRLFFQKTRQCCLQCGLGPGYLTSPSMSKALTSQPSLPFPSPHTLSLPFPSPPLLPSSFL